MNKKKVRVRLSYVYSGWVMECPLCPAVTVRDNWPMALATALRHVDIHQHGPFAAPGYAPRDAA